MQEKRKRGRPRKYKTPEEIYQEVLKAREGNEQSFGYLLDLVQPQIRYFQDPSRFWIKGLEKDDIKQECSETLLKAIKSYDPEKKSSFQSYAKLLMRRRLISLLQESKTQKLMPLNIAKSFFEPLFEDDDGTSVSFEDIIYDEEVPKVVESLSEIQKFENLKVRLFEVLSDLERKVFERRLSDLSYNEICDELDINYRSVDNAIQRATDKIRQVFAEDIYKYEKTGGYERDRRLKPKKRSTINRKNSNMKQKKLNVKRARDE